MAGRKFVLMDLAIRNKWTRGAEIGVYRGGTTFFIVEAYKMLHMIAVDNWKPNEFYNDMDEAEEHFVGKAKYFDDRIKILKMDSLDAAKVVEDNSLDFVFIDGDHSYEAVKADIAAWMPKVKTIDGMLGHDIDLESVKRAVEEVGEYDVLMDDIWRLKCLN